MIFRLRRFGYSALNDRYLDCNTIDNRLLNANWLFNNPSIKRDFDVNESLMLIRRVFTEETTLTFNVIQYNGKHVNSSGRTMFFVKTPNNGGNLP